MKNLEPLTDKEAITQLGLSEKVAKELEGKKYWDENIAMTMLMLKEEIPVEQYSKYLRLTSLSTDYLIGQMLFKYNLPKKRDRAMKMPEFLTQ